MSDDAIGLAALEKRLADDLASIEYPAPDWVPPTPGPDGQRVPDVAVIGAGMAGLCAGFALMREGIVHLACLDAAPEGLEGPWVTWARMQTLRSPKQLQGPALGIAALSFRAWFIAQWGRAAWDRLDKAPRGMWMDYLRWYRRATGVPVRNHARVTAIVPEGALYRLEISGAAPVFARHVVLATGRDGLGGPHVPEMFQHLPPTHCVHSSEAIDFDHLGGRDVVVVGASASAFDNAAAALEAGCASMTMLVRRPRLPVVNKFTHIAHAGFTHGLLAAPPADRLRLQAYAFTEQVPPPRESVLRVSRHARARMLIGCAVQAARMAGDRALLHTPRGVVAADFVILGTGFEQDIFRRPELAAVAPDVALWADHVADAGLFASSPWLDDAFAFTAKPGRIAPHLARLHCFNFAATVSHGKVSGDIPALSDGAQRLSRAIAARLFNADLARHEALLHAYARPELLGDEWPALPEPIDLPSAAE
jgi:cation diffusion facilitator CzcD-associated flavoprotein CzcO